MLATSARLSSADNDIIMSLPRPRLGIKDCLAFKLIFHLFPSSLDDWLEASGRWQSLAEREVIRKEHAQRDSQRTQWAPTHTRPVPLSLGLRALLSVRGSPPEKQPYFRAGQDIPEGP